MVRNADPGGLLPRKTGISIFHPRGYIWCIKHGEECEHQTGSQELQPEYDLIALVELDLFLNHWGLSSPMGAWLSSLLMPSSILGSCLLSVLSLVPPCPYPHPKLYSQAAVPVPAA
jgi:hypothetical protein